MDSSQVREQAVPGRAAQQGAGGWQAVAGRGQSPGCGGRAALPGAQQARRRQLPRELGGQEDQLAHCRLAGQSSRAAASYLGKSFI